jgi:hypothetical protein
MNPGASRSWSAPQSRKAAHTSPGGASMKVSVRIEAIPVS